MTASPKIAYHEDVGNTAAQAQARRHTRWLSWLRGSFVALIILSGIVLTPLTTRWPGASPLLRDAAVALGTLLISAGAALRLWAGLYIGGHKERELITCGPYSLVRNPLYLGNLLAAAGIGTLSGSPLVAAIAVGATLGVYLATIKSEECKLRPIFGAGYEAYLHKVPALLPHLADVRRLTHDATPCTISHRSLAREFTRCLGLAALGLAAFLLSVAPAKLDGYHPAASAAPTAQHAVLPG
jgi:protein-S-isoprenylcysteine O-methyltransferase Ste14